MAVRTAGWLALAGGIFFGDMRLKNRIETKRENPVESIWGGRILIKKHHNRGALLNIGQNRRKTVALFSVLLSAAIAVLFVLSLGRRGNSMLRAGLALLLGGAFSNTYDRLKRRYVVDYFSFNVKWKPLRRIVFNLSDFCLIIGAMLAALGC